MLKIEFIRVICLGMIKMNKNSLLANSIQDKIYTIKRGELSRDRFLIVDDKEVYHFGASF